MAKRDRYLRRVGKNGKIYYFELKKDKRGVEVYKPMKADKGAKKFVQKNYNKIKTAPKTTLSAREQKKLNRSRGQRNTFTYDGVRIKKDVVKYLQREGLLPKQLTKEITKTDLKGKIKRPADLYNAYQRLVINANEVTLTTQWGAEGFRYRTKNMNLVKISEEVSPWTKIGFEFIVYDEEGDPYSGQEAYAKIREYEIDTIERYKEINPDVAFVKFDYDVQIDPFERAVILDLTNQPEPDYGTSDPRDRTTESMDLTAPSKNRRTRTG